MIEVRPEIMAFARLMETKLRRDDERKGERGWKKVGTRQLCSRLMEEVQEFREACENAVDLSKDGGFREVVSEAVDVANFCMMIADVEGALDHVPNLVLQGIWSDNNRHIAYMYKDEVTGLVYFDDCPEARERSLNILPTDWKQYVRLPVSS